jgi:hypothetical protein
MHRSQGFLKRGATLQGQTGVTVNMQEVDLDRQGHQAFVY